MSSRVLRQWKKNKIITGRKDDYFTEKNMETFLLEIMLLLKMFFFLLEGKKNQDEVWNHIKGCKKGFRGFSHETTLVGANYF